jgi:chromate transport protein ChrA
VTTEVLGTLLGIQAVVIGILIRAAWRLTERVSRLEGRLNGERQPRQRPVD